MSSAALAAAVVEEATAGDRASDSCSDLLDVIAKKFPVSGKITLDAFAGIVSRIKFLKASPR